MDGDVGVQVEAIFVRVSGAVVWDPGSVGVGADAAQALARAPAGGYTASRDRSGKTDEGGRDVRRWMRCICFS